MRPKLSGVSAQHLELLAAGYAITLSLGCSGLKFVVFIASLLVNKAITEESQLE